MAPKVRKDIPKNKEAQFFEVVLVVCPKCREAKEIVTAKRGQLQLKEYYCCADKALELHTVVIKPNGLTSG